MTTPIADPMAALVEYLGDDDAVAALVEDRVFGLELPASEAQNMPRKCIVLEAGSGFSPSYAATLPLDAMSINVYSYGETPLEAMSVRNAARAALKDLERVVKVNCLLHWAKPSGGFAEQRDNPTTWPRVFESFAVLAAETAAA